MLKNSVLLFSIMLLVATGTAFADVSSCTGTVHNSCALYETQPYNGNPYETSGLVPLAVPYESPDYYLYVVLVEPGTSFDYTVTSNWSDVVEFSKDAVNNWYVQLFSEPLDSGLVNDIKTNTGKTGWMYETGVPTTFSTDGHNSFSVYSSEVPEPGSILLLSTVIAAVAGALRSRLAKS